MRKKGFTLVEVALFLALSGLLVAAVIIGTSRSISEKRYNDTVDNFVSYLEGLYSSVNYVRGTVGGGKSDKAIYGKLINMVTTARKTTFTSYTIKNGASTSNVTESDALEAFFQTGDDPELVPDSGEDYIPSWGGWTNVQFVPGDDKMVDAADQKSQILLLLIRHPRSGMTSTYVYYPDSEQTIGGDAFELKNLIGTIRYDRNFRKDQDANFCIDSDDRWAGGNERRFVKIHAGANNASGVELIGNEDRRGFCEN